MHEKPVYARKNIPADLEHFTSEEDDDLTPQQAFFIPMLVIMVSAILAFVAFKGIAPLADRLYASSPKTDAAEVEKGKAKALKVQIADFFTPEVKYWQPQIIKWAQQYQLDANLITTIMQIESCGDVKALSSSGAMGLFQVMPFHFEQGEDAFDPQINAQRGLGYLRKAFQSTQGDIRLTLASYNGGINGASQPPAYWSDQMHRYVKWGMGIYQDALAGKNDSETLQAWLAAGGSRLCEQARSRIAALQGGEEYSYNTP